ncbi:MAG: hypothetical protein PVF83_18735 [Anaerolineales bacterium]
MYPKPNKAFLASILLVSCVLLAACQSPPATKQPEPGATIIIPENSSEDVDADTYAADANDADSVPESNQESPEIQVEDQGSELETGSAKATKDPDEVVEHKREVNLKTTFAELLDWGLTRQEIETIVNGELPSDLDTRLRDYCDSVGISFNSIEEKLQAEVDQSS